MPKPTEEHHTRARARVVECLKTEYKAMKKKGPIHSSSFSDLRTTNHQQKLMIAESDAYFYALHERQLTQMKRRIAVWSL